MPARRRPPMLLTILAVCLLAPLVVMALFVDDWSRDLTTNRAHTGPGQKNQPWELLGVSVEQIADAAAAMAQAQSAWSLVDDKPLPDDSPLPALIGAEPAATHHFVRTTGLMRYKDDVWLLVVPQGDDSVTLYADSRSRLGKGDLGQNPRNLAELQFYLPTALGD